MHNSSQPVYIFIMCNAFSFLLISFCTIHRKNFCLFLSFLILNPNIDIITLGKFPPADVWHTDICSCHGECLHVAVPTGEHFSIQLLTLCNCMQGFPDSYKFSGNIHNKYRQIGHAVPPPLALALGRKLREAVDAKCST